VCLLQFYAHSISLKGVFNGDIALKKGTFVGIYAGEVVSTDEGERRGKSVTLH
jgi:hypothetical protein